MLFLDLLFLLLVALLSVTHPQQILYDTVVNRTNTTNATVPIPTLNPTENGSNGLGNDTIGSNKTDSSNSDSNNSSIAVNGNATIAPTPSSSTNNNTNNANTSNSSNSSSSGIMPSSAPSSTPSYAPTSEASSFTDMFPTVAPTASPPSVAPTLNEAATPTIDDDHQYTTNPTNSPTIYMSSFDRYLLNLFSSTTIPFLTTILASPTVKEICGHWRS